jgi:uncharacterized protein YwgA
MRWLLDNPENVDQVALTVAEAGGRVVGRTRLQKMFYLLQVAGYLDSFSYSYKHYGPYSEDLTQATTMACIVGSLGEDEYPTSWGGTYSVFTSHVAVPHVDAVKARLLELANTANPIDLELAATAIYIAETSNEDPWEETRRRKPEKANRIESAKQLVVQLRNLNVLKPFPPI